MSIFRQIAACCLVLTTRGAAGQYAADEYRPPQLPSPQDWVLVLERQESKADRAGKPLPNTAPTVVPALREWTGNVGNFTVSANPKICVDPNCFAELSGVAETFKRELDLIRICATIGSSDKPADGDFYLTTDRRQTGLGSEGYLLDVGDSVKICSPNKTGVVHGTISVLQILYQAKADKIIPKGVAKDYPRYQIRGQMLDPARVFIPVEQLKATVRLLGWYKYNELHLHLSDMEGFRIESTVYPGLASRDSYSKAEMTQIIEYAAQYGVNILPEIEMPAHTGLAGYFGKDVCVHDYPDAYPECNGFAFDFSKGNAEHPERDDPKTSIYAISGNLIKEFASLFPYTYFHMGGDEWPHWRPAIQSRTNEAVVAAADASPSQKAYARSLGFTHVNDLYSRFINFAHAQIGSVRKVARMWTWDQHIRQFSCKMDPDNDIVYDLWNYRPEEDGVSAYVKANRKIVNCNPLYLYNDIKAVKPAGELYEKWTPNMFNTECHESWHYEEETIDPNYANLLGAKAQNWAGVAMKPRMQPLAEILWCGSKQSKNYGAFCDRLKIVGEPVGESR